MTARNDPRHGPRPVIRNLADPDEVLTLQDAVAHTVHVGDLSIGRLVMQPGWRWSTAVRPLSGTDSCQFHHVGLGISGSAHFVMDDGTEFDVRPSDVFDIPRGTTTGSPATSPRSPSSGAGGEAGGGPRTGTVCS